MKTGKAIRRFLIPSWFVTLYCLMKFRAQVSTKSEVELGPNLKLGKKVVISSFCKIKIADGPLAIGDHVNIATGCFISSHREGIVIGKDSLIGPNSVIVSSNYNYGRRDIPYRLQGHSSRGIRIGQNVFIGGNVAILDGAEIGNDAIIAAGTLVSGKIPAGAIVQGNPMKIMYTRK